MPRSSRLQTRARPVEGHEPGAHARYLAPPFLLVGLLALLLGLILGIAAVRPPAAQPVGADSDDFSAEAALPLLSELLGSGPHPIGTPANVEVRERLIATLRSLGLEVSTQEAFACREQWFTCGNVVNVMTRLPGNGEGPAVLLTAHYDSVGAGPGVSDDLAGVVAILEAARLLLEDEPMRNSVILLFTDGEEMGLLGAEAFALHPWLDDVGVVVNLEARGTAGQSILFETSDDNSWLIEAFAAEAPRPVTNSLLFELYRLLPNDTDFSVYKEAGKAGINFAYIEELAHYHTPLDDLTHLSHASLQHHGDNVLAAARAFGQLDLSRPPPGNSIYLDLLPGSVVRAPVSWAVPASIVLLLLWLVMIVVLLGRGLLDWVGVFLGLLAAMLTLALAAALGLGVSESLAVITDRPSFFHAEPVATRAALWLAALLGTLIAYVPLARRAGFWGLTSGTWLLWALACLATAVALPGASIFFLVPLLASVALFASTLFTPLWRSARAAPMAAALAALVTAYLWLPLVLAVESGLGLELAPAISVCAALAFTAFAALVAQPPGQGLSRAVLMLAVVAAMVVSGAVAVNAENFSEQRPQRLSLLHLQTAQEGEAQAGKWLIDAYPLPALTEQLQEVESFEWDDSARLPWTGAAFLSAAAPLLDYPVPGLTVLSEETTNEGRIITLELLTPRQAPRLSLVVPGGAGLQHIVVPGTRYVMEVENEEDRTVFTCHGANCDGTVLELHFGAGGGPLTFTVADLSYGLPAEGAALLAARPANAVPSQDGDVTVVLNSVSL